MRKNIKKNKIKINLPIFKRSNLLWFSAFSLLGLYVYFTVQMSAMGVKIAEYEEDIQKLEGLNEGLSQNYINSTSLTKLSLKAEELGYRKIENTLYIKGGDNFAKAE